MKNFPSIVKKSLLLPAIFGCILTFSLFSCRKDNNSTLTGAEKKNLAATDLEGYYLVTENNAWNPRMSLFYFGKTDGKLMVTQDGPGLRRGYEAVIEENHLKIGSDGQTFDFLFEKTSGGDIVLKSFSGSASHAEMYRNSESFPVAGRTFSRKWEQVNGVLYHIGFNSTKFIDGIAGIIPEEGYSYYTVGSGVGWKSDTGHGSYMGVTVSSWKGNGKKTLLVEKRAGNGGSPKIDVYVN
ncbi:hypothetical protein [Niabella drilacis]|uniref:Uncharacterized protein n=1 Tax=Niabella drilacis (strain DSM 25811 / CCM 8410 / CCUG 62505 / LMG 26954 / E90) TaxID=1285928 RepID=A0A1G6QDD4_NIADE|nr:hypothetical protein [Niabella drilacis]SDC89695.1 hypothetical protein SAMN04487894_104348 [Niabella drilacis]